MVEPIDVDGTEYSLSKLRDRHEEIWKVKILNKWHSLRRNSDAAMTTRVEELVRREEVRVCIEPATQWYGRLLSCAS